MISAFVGHCLDSIIPLVSISEISSLYQASVAAQAGLSLTWLQTPKTGFLMMRLEDRRKQCRQSDQELYSMKCSSNSILLKIFIF